MGVGSKHGVEPSVMGFTGGRVSVGVGEQTRQTRRRDGRSRGMGRTGGGVGWPPDVVKRVGTSLGISVRIFVAGGGESVSVEEQARCLLGHITS